MRAVAFLKRLVGKDERLELANARLDAQIEELSRSAASIDSLTKRLDEVSHQAKQTSRQREVYKKTISGSMEAVRVNQAPGFRRRIPSGI